MATRRSIVPWRRNPQRRAHRFGAQQIAMPSVEESVKQLSARLEEWQQRVLTYADLIPEVMTGYQFVHNTLDLVTYELQKFNRDTNEWEKDNSAEGQGIERRINLAFKSGRAGALGHLVEEAYILVERTDDNDFTFETLAPTEIQSKRNHIEKRILVDGEKDKWVKVEPGTTIIRVYNPDPKNRDQASGPHKALLGLLETMALEILRDQAEAVSVLSGNGLLLIPTEVLPDEVDSVDSSETPGSRRGFENRLEEAMVLTVTDRKRGEAIVPITLYGPAEALAEVRHVVPHRSENAYEVGARMDRYVTRYARSIDLPAQVILGIGESNHWGDWKVDENTWAYHLFPRAQRIADALYSGVVQFVIKNLGRNPEEYRLFPDASKAIAKSDLTRAALDAYKMGALKGDRLMEAIGFEGQDLRVDADDLLLAQIASAGAGGDATEQRSLPERTAASSNPRVILRQVARAANAQQVNLERLMRRILERVAKDAARDGAANLRTSQDLAASTGHRTGAGEIEFVGYKPGTYFAEYSDELMSSTREELTRYLRRISELSGTEYRTLRSVWAAEFEARAASVAKQAGKFAEDIASSSYQSGKPARVLNSQVRSLSSTANGGANQIDRGAKNVDRPKHAGEDPMTRDVLVDVVGEYATQYTWVTGHPIKPFPAHQELDGLTWFSWQEFDALDVSDDDDWLPGTVYFPGDHDGCQCSYEVDFIPKEDAA